MCIQRIFEDLHLALTSLNQLNFPIVEEAAANQNLETERAEVEDTETRTIRELIPAEEFEEDENDLWSAGVSYDDFYDGVDDFYGEPADDFYDEIDFFGYDDDLNGEGIDHFLFGEETPVPFNHGHSISRLPSHSSEISNDSEDDLELYQMEQVENVQTEFTVPTSDLDDIVEEISRFEDSDNSFAIAMNATRFENGVESEEDYTSSNEEKNLASGYRQLAAELRDARRYNYEYPDVIEHEPASQENNSPIQTQGFITASKFLEMSQTAKNENPPPLNEEIVKENEIVIQIVREHSVEPSQQLVIEEDLEFDHKGTAGDNSNLNQSILELSRKLSTQNELNQSLSSLSQKLNDSNVLTEYLQIAKSSCERMKELEYREAMEKSLKVKEKRLMKSVCGQELSFDTQVYENNLQKSQQAPEPPPMGGFAFASGKTLNVNRNAVRMYEKYFGDEEMEGSEGVASLKEVKTKPIEVKSNYNGFSFASGRTLNIDKKVVEQYEQQFEVEKEDSSAEISPDSFIESQANNKVEEDLSQITRDISNVESDFPLTFVGFKFASGMAIGVDREKVDQFKRNFESPLREEADNAKKFCFESEESKPARKSLVFAPAHASSPVVAPQPPMTIRSFQTRRSTTFETTPSPTVTRRRHLRRVNKENDGFVLDTKNTEGSSASRQTLVDLSLNVKSHVDFSQRMLFGADKEDEMSEQDLVKFLAIEKVSMEENRKMVEVRAQREIARQEQSNYIRDKPASDCRSMQGTLMMMKSAKNRITLDLFVENEKPTDKKLHSDEFFEFAEKFGNEIHVILGDNAKVILNDNSTIGFEQIKQGFLSSPGVDPKLLNDKWIDNAFSMIVRKFMWMENSFEKFNKFDVLTPNNVLLQLKYRYDREIDLHQRPAIRKIVELDEISQRRVVLKVIDIICTAQNIIELQLSDGWYSIGAVIDSCLMRAVLSKKIRINDKLIISGALLQNNENGYDPLELPECVKLQIYGNSTRLTNQNTKLGFCKNPWPFLISLDSVCDDGLLIGKLHLHIVQVYPLIFVESNGERLEYRSERMQARINDQNEVVYSRLLESIFEKVVTKFREQLADRVEELKTIPLDSLSITDITDILVYEQNSTYGMRLWDHLSHVQRNGVISQRQELNAILKSKAVNEVQSNKGSKTDVMLKFRVVDLKNPNKTALICWYRPNEGILDSVKEGVSLEMSNLMASKTIGEIQLRSHPQGISSFRILKTTKPEKFETFVRKESLFPEMIVNEFNPPLKEFDTACIIVRIDDKDEDMGFQDMYVADDEMNLLCIKFLPNINDFAYENFLKERAIFFIRNLQWRNTSCQNNLSIPEAFVIPDSTSFVGNPSKSSQRNRLQKFRATIGEVEAFCNNCREKLNELVGSDKTTPKLSLEENPYLKRFYSVRQYGKSCAPRRFRFN